MSILSSAIAKFAESQLNSAWLRNGQRVTRTKTARRTAVFQRAQGGPGALVVKSFRTSFVGALSAELSGRLKLNFDDLERSRRHAVSHGRFVLPCARHSKQLRVVERMDALLQRRGRDVAILVDRHFNQTLEARPTVDCAWGHPAGNRLRDDDR